MLATNDIIAAFILGACVWLVVFALIGWLTCREMEKIEQAEVPEDLDDRDEFSDFY
ncbi:MAG: hypothetical protein JKY89_10905 [Immundisolibacteraceae bacterium]|nr:hypothetical protein [Immundisolibacteraceae bacterium]